MRRLSYAIIPLVVGASSATAQSTAAGPSQTETGLTVAFLVLFVLTILATRWHHIARSVHEMLLGQLKALLTRLSTEVEDPEAPGVYAIHCQAKALETEVKSWSNNSLRSVRGIAEFVFWSRGRENAAWVEVHEIERQAIAFLAPPQLVRTNLIRAEAQLRLINKPVAVAVAEAVSNCLKLDESAQGAQKAELISARKALLGQAISIIYAESDLSFTTLMEWQDKASWLLIAALIIIGFLTGVAGHAILFLVGAAGGFSSRVSRALHSSEIPLDYGASWSTLFLSPVFGALAAWFGVAIITLAASDKVNMLGTMFSLVKWDDPTRPETIGIAFALGFSERFFDALVGAVEKTTPGQTSAQPPRLTTPGTVVDGNQKSNGDGNHIAGENPIPAMPLNPGERGDLATGRQVALPQAMG